MNKKQVRNQLNTCPVFSSTITFSDKNVQVSSTFQQSFVDHQNGQPNMSDHNSSFLSEISERSSKNSYNHPILSPRFGKRDLQQDEKSSFKTIEIILKNQNFNLKLQNQFLLKQVYRLKATNHKYKQQLRLKHLEAHAIKQQCSVQKKRADDLKDLAMKKLSTLQQKISQNNNSISLSECSLLDILNQAQDK